MSAYLDTLKFFYNKNEVRIEVLRISFCCLTSKRVLSASIEGDSLMLRMLALFIPPWYGALLLFKLAELLSIFFACILPPSYMSGRSLLEFSLLGSIESLEMDYFGSIDLLLFRSERNSCSRSYYFEGEVIIA